MVAAYHLIWTTYGSWLPNDPRGSNSHKIHCARIAALGELHRGRKRVQPAGQEIREFYEAARGVLQHKLHTFTVSEFSTLAEAFASTIKQQTYTCYACAIMPDHVHLVIRKHRHQAEEMIALLQENSRRNLLAVDSNRRSADHPVWGGPGWKVFLDSQQDIERTIHYVEQNPVKIGRPMQHWEFVKSYDGWLPGQVKIIRKKTKSRAER